MEGKGISKAVISRLPRYFRYLGQLRDDGVERISSHELSERMKVTASQIRQDFNNFGGFGQQGYGYNVQYLYDEIGKILGLHKTHRLIVIGAGNLGQALTNYVDFEKRGFIIQGIFDCNERLHGRKIRDRTILSMDDNDIDIGVLTLPKEAALKVAEQLISYGIKAIWNFAHIDLHLPSDIIVENVHLSDSLMQLSYNLNRHEL